MGNFKNLRVWSDAVDLATGIYKLTAREPFSKDFGLSSQIQRAAVSIASNIAEGDERNSNKEAIHFFHIAKGSAAEVITQLNIAYRIGYLKEDTFKRTEDFTEKIRASLKNLIKERAKKI
ncbi:MAG: four helix bundle protein [Bacteroidota bacterium]